MATIFTIDGKKKSITFPTFDNPDDDLDFYRGIVGGRIEELHLVGDRLMFANEESKILDPTKHPEATTPNSKATKIYQEGRELTVDNILGNVIVFEKEEVDEMSCE